MRLSRKKISTSRSTLDVTCSEGVKKRVDDFLTSEYQAWKQGQQPRRDSRGFFTCGMATSNTLIMDYVRYIYNEYDIVDPLANQPVSNHKYSSGFGHERRGNSLNFDDGRIGGEGIKVQIHESGRDARYETPTMK